MPIVALRKHMKALCISSVIYLLLLGLSPFCLAQVVTVRVIDITNGHPLKHQHVLLFLFYNDKKEPLPAKYDKITDRETNINGEAQFALPEPPPKRLDFKMRMSSAHWHYVENFYANTQEVIQKGFVEPHFKPKKTDALVKAVPGEIILFARPTTFFYRLFYPIMKG